MELTADDVADILHALDGLQAGELRLETASFRLFLRRDGNGQWTHSVQALGQPNLLAGTGVPVPPPRAAEPVAAEPEAAPAGELTEVRAPLLGTFYRAPRPGAPPFVTVGARVEPDTVVCIIETMKLMNSVTAGVSGTVAEILLDNAQFADQGTVLMTIREG